MKVICIEENEVERKANHITYGKVYDVVQERTKDNIYMIIGDNGEETGVYTKRFIVKDNKMKQVKALRNWRNQFGGITAGNSYVVTTESTSGYFIEDNDGKIIHLPKNYFAEGYSTVPSWPENKSVKAMKYTLPDGSTIEGTTEQVNTLLTKLGVMVENDGVHYMSSSKGFLVIKDMNTSHLRNAFLKLYGYWLETLRTLPLSDFLLALRDGNHRDATFVAMLKELLSRKV